MSRSRPSRRQSRSERATLTNITLIAALGRNFVIGADGTMTGYAGGVWRKQALIRHETDRFGGQSAFWDQLA